MLQTPLAEEYALHGGRVVDFHGWGLPVHFQGIIEEHRHVRARAGVFDCSHMGEFLIEGYDALVALDRLVISDLVSLAVGKCRYTAITDENAGIVDDCVAFRYAPAGMMLVTNAGPYAEVSALLQRNVSGVRDITAQTAKIDVQGPFALQALESIGFEGLRCLPFWHGCKTSWNGIELLVTRAGYTGELGYEIYAPVDCAVSLWHALIDGAAVTPCGLGARDTLRTEMGYPLSGQDVDRSRTPLEAGMNRFIAWDSVFPGKDRLEIQRNTGDHVVLVALRSNDKRAPRHGFELRHDDTVVGCVTSGTYGPTVGCGIGLGYVPVSLAHPGTALRAGPRDMSLKIEKPPLYKNATGRMKIEVD